MKVMTRSYPASAHLKGRSSFNLILIRQLASTSLLATAAVFSDGAQLVFAATIFPFAVIGTSFIFQITKIDLCPRWDLTLFSQAGIVILFLPLGLSWGMLLAGAVLLVGFYRFSGGRGGYVLQPACLVLAFLQCLGMKPQFHLGEISPFVAGVIFILWLVMRFPKTQIEVQRMLTAALLVPLFCLLHEERLTTAVLLGAVASELVFDPALAPLSAKGRKVYWVTTLVVATFFLAVADSSEALILAGLSAGFFAAWIETRSMTRKKK